MSLLVLTLLSLCAGIVAGLAPWRELAVPLALVAGIVLATLAALVGARSRPFRIDNAVATWADRHGSAWSSHALDVVTQLGAIEVVVGLAALLLAFELHRRAGRWVLPFVVAVVGGEEILATAIKHTVDRPRPTLNQAAAALGPAFPSGHSATAAAFYAAAALLLGRERSPAARAWLNGAAVGIAVAVAASRVLLDLHWFTDVIGGLALGWAWVAICAITVGLSPPARRSSRAARTRSSGAVRPRPRNAR